MTGLWKQPLAAVCSGVLLAACSGAEIYRGSWQGLDSEAAQKTVVFEEKQFSNTDVKTEERKTYAYTQTHIHYDNGRREYGIQVAGADKLWVVFPFPDNHSRALLTTAEGDTVMTLSRQGYLTEKQFWAQP